MIGSGFFVALGWITALGFVVQYWQVFAFVTLGIIVLRCLHHTPAHVTRHAQVLANRKAEDELNARIARRS